MTTFLSTNNISLFTVPAAWLLCMIPHIHDRLTDDSSHQTLPSPSPPPPPPPPPTKPSPPTSTTSPTNPPPSTLPLFSSAVTAANLALIIIHANEGPPTSYAHSLWFVNTQCLGYLAAHTLHTWCCIWGRSTSGGGWWRTWGREVWVYAGAVCGMRLWWWAGRGLKTMVK